MTDLFSYSKAMCEVRIGEPKINLFTFLSLQHLQYYKVYLAKEKNLVGPMKAKNWLQIAQNIME
ncbi:hypothetical protein UB43_05520 [Pseudomonas sp. 21]|nr:hypothetical protein UB43_05520 [Pseudomonas sp. 21]